MSRSGSIPFTMTLVLSLVGLADAAIGNGWDLFVLFAAIAVVQSIALVTNANNREQVSIRPDLARWVHQRAQRTGESATDVVDRSLAWYQRGLYRSEPTETGDDDHGGGSGGGGDDDG